MTERNAEPIQKVLAPVSTRVRQGHQDYNGTSLSPLHLETIDEADMLKNVVLHSVATALASNVFPVPGGPYNNIPFQGVRIPVNSLDEAP